MNRTLNLLFAGLFVIFMPLTPAGADLIFQCEVNGVVVYSDAPCATTPEKLIRANAESGFLYEVHDESSEMPGPAPAKAGSERPLDGPVEPVKPELEPEQVPVHPDS